MTSGVGSPPGGGSRETLDVTLMEPELAVEVGVDVARHASSRWRYAAPWHRARPDLSPVDAPAGRWRADGGTGAEHGHGFAVASGPVVSHSRTRAQF
jgi:hypothetical protein